MDVVELKLSQIHESPLNPRKTFHGIEDLAADIKRHGVLQAIMVRPATAAGVPVPDRYELVFGARRYRASHLAGLKVLPAVIRELGDAEAREVMIVENSKREDIHPLEEGQGYKDLRDINGVPVPAIAELVGQSASYIHNKIKLCEIEGKARVAFAGGQISESLALLLARIPNAKLQVEAFEYVSTRGGGDRDENDKWVPTPMTARLAAEWIRKHYMLKLSEAPFDRKDAGLVAAAGACSNCPKRTGAQPDLFADVKGGDVCIDPPCFQKKLTAHKALERQEVKEKGLKMLSEKDAKAVFDPYSNGHPVRRDSEFVEVDKKLKKALGDEAEVVIGRDPDGKLRELVKRSTAAELVKSKGLKLEIPEPTGMSGGHARAADYAAERERERLKHEGHLKVAHVVLARVVEKVESTEPTAKFWRELALTLVEDDYDEDIAKRRGFESNKELAKVLDKMSEKMLRGVVWEFVVARTVFDEHRGPKTLKAICDAHKLDLSKVKVEAKEADQSKCRKCSEPCTPGGDQVCYRCAQAESRERRKAERAAAEAQKPPAKKKRKLIIKDNAPEVRS